MTYKINCQNCGQQASISRKHYRHLCYPCSAEMEYQAKLAGQAVLRAKKAGKLPAAETQQCVECGNEAQEYHHYKGYDKANRLDVQPMCIPCHVEERTRAAKMRVKLYDSQ